ncbi:MAG: 50S ribosomal protein L13 [Sulfolobales archaeon]
MKIREFIESIEKTYPKNSILIIDGENHILGRLASVVAKLLLKEYRVYIVNAEKIVLSGPRRRVIEGYKLLLEVRTHKNPYKGPKRPRNPINIVKRAIRGMLPKESDRGFRAYKRLRVFIGVPSDLRDKPKIKIPFADASKLKGSYVYISEVAKELGWSPSE